MTREEAYNRIDAIIAKHEIDDEYVTVTNEKDYDALRLCRKVIEQEPCEDAISRQAAIKAITNTSGIRGDALKALYDLPSVNPQPKTGHWIMSDDGLYRPICDKCGAHPWKGYIPTVEEATEVFKYCPSCGSYNGGD